MGFINNNENKPKTAGVDAEINSLVKARGFDPGNYKFVPKQMSANSPMPKPRPDGSIINGEVKGNFSMNTNDINPIIFEREDFSDSAWRKICARIGFKYHNITDIDKFTIIPNSVDVEVSIVTPNDEV